MNTILKTAIASAILLGSASAHALTAPSSGASDLILYVQDTTKNTTYALDTGISVSTALPTGSLVSGASLSTAIAGLNQTITTSTTLSGFLNTTDSFVWGIQAGYFPTTANNADRTAGAAAYVFTSVLGGGTPTAISGLTLGNMNNILTNFNVDANAIPFATGTETTAAAWSTTAQTQYGQLGTTASDAAALGASVGLFGITGNGGTGAVQSYKLGSVSLTTAGLSFTPNTTVPLPAAVWLLGSGLLGLFGVSRRRAA